MRGSGLMQGKADTVQQHILDTDQWRSKQGGGGLLPREEIGVRIQGKDPKEGNKISCHVGQGLLLFSE